MIEKISVALLGAEARGRLIGGKMAENGDKFELKAICDIDPNQIEKCRTLFNISQDMAYSDEESFFEEKRADLLVIATYDKEHVRQCIRAMELGYNILVEKLLVLSAVRFHLLVL